MAVWPIITFALTFKARNPDSYRVIRHRIRLDSSVS